MHYGADRALTEEEGKGGFVSSDVACFSMELYYSQTSLSLEIIHKTNPRRLLPKEDSIWNSVEIKPLQHYTCLGNSIVLGT